MPDHPRRKGGNHVTRRGETLELAVLGLLHDHPMHGYELRKRLNVVLGWGRVLSYGSLYPALKKMSRAGWLSERIAAAEAATGRASRRQRIVYKLTPAGNERFATLMAESGPAAWEDDNFDVRFAFFGRTDREIRLRILEGRRARLEERLAKVKENLSASQGAHDSYTAELRRHGIESVEREVRWLTDLIAAERGASTPDSATSPRPEP